MKIREHLIACIVLLLTSFAQARAQCGTQVITRTITGDGNSVGNFTIPQYNAGSSNYLVSIDIRVSVVLNYSSFNLENKDGSNRSISVKPFYHATLTSGAISNPVTIGDLDQSWNATIGTYPLSAADGTADSGPDYTTVSAGSLSRPTFMNESIYDANDLLSFTGTGNVNLSYTPDLGTLITGGTASITGNSYVDQVTFTITYHYCPLTPLAGELSLFTATKKSNEQIDLRWINQTERIDRIYTLEKSNNGADFSAIQTVKAVADANNVGDYQYSYHPVNGETGKLYFRVKQTEYNGDVKYSSVRIVEIGNAASNANSMSLYPNPTKNSSTLVFSTTQPGDWKVDIFTLPGQIVQQLQFKNTLKADLNSNGNLASGVYFLKITNQQTQKQFTQRLVIQ